MAAKSLNASDITVVHGSPTLVSPFDCGSGPFDDNDGGGHGDPGGYDYGYDDHDSGGC